MARDLRLAVAFVCRGTQQNAATEAAHAEYKVRFQPIEKANAACSQGPVLPKRACFKHSVVKSREYSSIAYYFSVYDSF